MKLKTREGKGITLIALVITIIVLLILAGVTIVTLTGENGILTQAENAKKKSEIAQAKEEIELAVLNSRINDNYDASIDTNKLKEELGKLGIDIVGIDELPYTVTNKEYVFEITAEGKVNLKEGISLNKTNLTFKIADGEVKTETLIANKINIQGDIAWTSSNTDVATVDNNGTVTTVGEGETTITATCSGSSASCTVTVSKLREFTFTVGSDEFTALSGMTWRDWVSSDYAAKIDSAFARTFY